MKKLMILCLPLLVLSCTPTKNKEGNVAPVTAMSIQKSSFGILPTGAEATLFTLTNANGMQVSMTDYGGIITTIMAQDKQGKWADVVLGYDSVQGYVADNPYFGAIIGRYGNRIAKGKFSLDGNDYQLATNNNHNHLHGGIQSFNKVLWTATPFQSDSIVGVRFNRTSQHLEEGYPGNLICEIIYTLNNQNQLIFDYQATTDQKTIVNLTNHSYFNLTGDATKTILSHELVLAADQFLPVDSTLIPTGERKSVANTPFDFQSSHLIGERIIANDTQLTYGKGYDHCWIFSDQSSDMKWAGSLYEPVSGRLMNVYTTEIAIQFYSGNFLDGTLVGKRGNVYKHRSGLCLETQHFPDSPNQPSFPTTVLSPNEVYTSKTIYEFTVK